MSDKAAVWWTIGICLVGVVLAGVAAFILLSRDSTVHERLINAGLVSLGSAMSVLIPGMLVFAAVRTYSDWRGGAFKPDPPLRLHDLRVGNLYVMARKDPAARGAVTEPRFKKRDTVTLVSKVETGTFGPPQYKPSKEFTVCVLRTGALVTLTDPSLLRHLNP